MATQRASTSRNLLLVCELSAVFTLATAATAQSTCSAAYSGAWFPADWPAGSSGIGAAMDLSASGARVAIGASFAAFNGTQSGAVYVISDYGTPRAREDVVLPSTGTAQRRFGTSVALSAGGDVLVAGAPGGAFGAPGNAYVFRHDGRSWSEELVVSSAWPDEIGYSVDISDDGTVFVAGAPSRSPGGNLVTGAVEVFRRQGNSWLNEATVIPNDIVLSHQIGVSIALSGDGRFLAGRTRASVQSIPSSRVYIFERVGGLWIQQAKLLDPVGIPSPGFGLALDFDASGELLAVGNFQDSRVAYLQGAVTIFRRTVAAWGVDSVLLPSTPSNNGLFGRSVALNAAGDRLLVGAPGQQFAGLQSGVVEEFEGTSTGWQLRAVHAGPNPTFDSGFGRWLGMNTSGSQWVTSEPYTDWYGPNFGEVHLYEATCLTPQVYCTAQTNTLGCLPAIEAQGTPSVSSSSGFRIAARNLRNRQNGMLIYGTSGRATLPWLGGTLCVAPPLRRTPLVNSGGSLAPANDCSGALVRDFNAWAFASNDPELFAGQHVRAQFYSRDPGAAQNVNLSDAVEFYLEP